MNNCWRPVLHIGYCATCAHEANTGLHIETERLWDTLTTHGHTSTAAGLSFYTPNFCRDVKMAAHLVGRWLQERGHVPMAAQLPAAASTPTTNHDHASNWDNGDIGEQRDQT